MNQTTKKKLATITAGVLAVITAVSGTMAWQSIGQMAKNESRGVANPGGRLHDDYDGANKAVYVENFTDPNANGQNIYVRVRLSEYMEIGAGAGIKENTGENHSTPLMPDAKIDDITTWEVYTPEGAQLDEGNPEFREFFDLTVGSTKNHVYMPTFDKNKDSLQADINGTYAGPDKNYNTPDDAYQDHVEYKLGDTVQGFEFYDADSDNEDEPDKIENQDFTTAFAVHSAREIDASLSQVILMDDWVANPVKGNYWVYDKDGWAYWANPLAAGETTGLLLSQNARTSIPIEGEWYYAMNVEGQFITRDDIGKDDQSGFYKDNDITSEAEALLAFIGVDVNGTGSTGGSGENTGGSGSGDNTGNTGNTGDTGNVGNLTYKMVLYGDANVPDDLIRANDGDDSYAIELVATDAAGNTQLIESVVTWSSDRGSIVNSSNNDIGIFKAPGAAEMINPIEACTVTATLEDGTKEELTFFVYNQNLHSYNRTVTLNETKYYVFNHHESVNTFLPDTIVCLLNPLEASAKLHSAVLSAAGEVSGYDNMTVCAHETGSAEPTPEPTEPTPEPTEPTPEPTEPTPEPTEPTPEPNNPTSEPTEYESGDGEGNSDAEPVVYFITIDGGDGMPSGSGNVMASNSTAKVIVTSGDGSDVEVEEIKAEGLEVTLDQIISPLEISDPIVAYTISVTIADGTELDEVVYVFDSTKHTYDSSYGAGYFFKATEDNVLCIWKNGAAKMYNTGVTAVEDIAWDKENEFVECAH